MRRVLFACLLLLVAVAPAIAQPNEQCIVLPWPAHPPGAPDDPVWSLAAGTAPDVLWVGIRNDAQMNQPQICIGWRGEPQDVELIWWTLPTPPPLTKKFSVAQGAAVVATAYRQWPDNHYEVASVMLALSPSGPVRAWQHLVR